MENEQEHVCYCGKKIEKHKKYCSLFCKNAHVKMRYIKKQAGLDGIYDVLNVAVDPKVVEKLKTFVEDNLLKQYYLRRELYKLESRVREQNNLWNNLIRDIEEEEISPSHIRWWSKKLIEKYNFDSKNRMIGWLQGVAEILETYNKAKNAKKA